MIKFDGSFPWVPRILYLTLCLSCLVVNVHGKQNLNEPKKKDARYDSKTQATKVSDSHLEINPEMVLLTGLQNNNLDVIPIKEGVPKEVYTSKAGDKPIVISVSNDKQVLSEENHMLPTPILFDANLTDAEFFRNLWLRLNLTANSGPSADVEGVQKAATLPVTNAKVTSKDNVMPKEKSADWGKMQRNEMKPTLAAIHKDFEIANEASTDLPDNFNQTLSSDQLLCVIYKLLTLYKPNFAEEISPANAAKHRVPKYSYAMDKSTLKPIDTILYNLALSKASRPVRYKSPWNYHTSPPNEFGYDAATCAAHRTADYGLSDGQILAQKAASILDTLPLVKTFNKYSSLPSLDGDFSDPFSAPMNRPHEGSLPSFEVKNQKHKSEIHSENLNQIHRDRENISSRNIHNHDDTLTERMRTISNGTAKHLRQPAIWSDLPEDTYNLYSKLFQQLQDDGRKHRNHAFRPFDMDFLHSLTLMQQAKPISKNHTFPISTSDFSSSYNKMYPDNIHLSYKENNPSDRSLNANTFSKSVSAYYNPEKGETNPSNFSDQKYFNRTVDYEKDPKESSNSRLPHSQLLKKKRRKGKQNEEKRRKKFELQIKRKSKMEGKKKTLDFDFLDLLSKSMIRESKNFEGRI